ncbi:MAG: DNA internalization-related competence protein ComEC/Rec2 [Coprobacillus cateniformis]|uniref:DNA internalization-related competence protein ComEC/Rec2 n=1 Tax=Coprobacillus cateniformis TaxID=100884 RepID=UPI003990D781
MLIRYHIFYYAVSCLLVVIGVYYHELSFLFLFGFMFYLYKRFGIRYVIVAILLSIIVVIPRDGIQELPHSITGQVIKTSDKYCYVRFHEGVMKLYHEEDIRYGDTVQFTFKILDMSENTNDNAFNEKLYLYSQKIFYKGKLKQLSVKNSKYSLYQWIEDHLSSEKDVSNYQRLFLLGERTEDIQNEYQQLSQLSLIHLFALSGMHVHILYMMLKKGLGICVHQKYAKWLAYVFIGIYVFSIPINISLYRAFFVMVLYEIMKKWLNQLDVLSLLVIVSLLYNPYIIYNISFIFSYFIYFIVLVTKHIKSSALMIYLSGLPIILTLNYQIPLVAFVVGNILTPFIEAFYCFCCLSIIIPVFLLPLSLCIQWLQSIMIFVERINQFIVFSKPSFSFIIMYYILYFMILYRIEQHKSIQINISIMIALLVTFSFYSQYKLYAEVTMIDVGQGDCTLIRLPMNQGNILIDTGGNKDYDLATQTIIPYLKSIGIQKLDYVYISHSDFDHCGALESLIEHFHVDQVIDRYEEERIIGCMKVKMFKSNKIYFDNNDQSLIMLVELFENRILFTGDASSQVEEDLRKQYRNLNVDILKISHHGSKTATSASLLQMIQPDIAMIGVRKNNMYHHPSSEVIERLKRKQITILRTDEDGMFHIRFYGKSRYILK